MPSAWTLQYTVRCAIRGNVLKAYGSRTIKAVTGSLLEEPLSLHIRVTGSTVIATGYIRICHPFVIEKNISSATSPLWPVFCVFDNDAYIGKHVHAEWAGVAVAFTHHVRMFDNDFIENWGDSIVWIAA